MIPANTIETIITGPITTVIVNGTETSGSVSGYNTHTTFDESATYTLSCAAGGTKCDTLTETIFYWPSETPIVISYSGTTSYLELTESISTIVEVPSFVTEIVTDGISTQVTLDAITTTLTTSGSTTVGLTVPAASTSIYSSTLVTVPESLRSADSEYSTTITISATTIYFNVAAATTDVSFEGVTTELTQIATFTLVIPESTSFFVSDGMVSSYVTTISGTESSESSSPEESTSDTNISSEGSTSIEECQKVKHCFTFIVYNGVHYHISSLLSSSKKEK